MTVQSIVLGETYRHRSNPNMGYAKAVKVLHPKQAPNPYTYSIVECEWTIGKNDTFGLVKYFKPSDLLKDKK